MRGEEPIEFGELFAASDGSEDDPSECPECDGTLVALTAIQPADTDEDGRVVRHCGWCETRVDQHWHLASVDVADSDDDRTFETRLDSCPSCDAPLEAVGNFYDHHDGTGRQEYSCSDCAVELDEWWEFQGSVVDDDGEA